MTVKQRRKRKKKGAISKSPTTDMRAWRWRFLTCLSIFIISLSIWAYSELTATDTFPIQHVKIDGSFEHVSKSSLREISLPYVDTGFFAVDVASLQEVIEKLPWVAEANIRRVWPSTIIILIKEQQPVARWGASDLMIQTGMLFHPTPDSVSASLPQLDGPEGQELTVLKIYQEMNDILAHLGLKVSCLSLTDRRAWQAGLNNGMELYLGRIDTMKRVKRFVSSYNQIFGSRGSDVAYVDLRYTNGLSVKWKQT